LPLLLAGCKKEPATGKSEPPAARQAATTNPACPAALAEADARAVGYKDIRVTECRREAVRMKLVDLGGKEVAEVQADIGETAPKIYQASLEMKRRLAGQGGTVVEDNKYGEKSFVATVGPTAYIGALKGQSYLRVHVGDAGVDGGKREAIARQLAERWVQRVK
jgi:hypothetical protein